MASESYKLLIDSTDAPPLEVLEEQVNKDEPKKLYIEGIFGQAGKINKNGRVYDLQEMIADVERYDKEYIQEARAFNELDHPDRPDLMSERVSDRTVKMSIDEKTGEVYGKALVMPTPMGLIQKAFIESGGRLGKSSRAMGQLRESRDDNGRVCNYVTGLRLVCYDTVLDPSVSTAMVDPLLEKRDWIVNNEGGWMERPFDKLEKSISTLPRKNQEQYLVECFKTFLKDIKM